MSPLFTQTQSLPSSMHSFAQLPAHDYLPDDFDIQQGPVAGDFVMDSHSTADETALYRMPVSKIDLDSILGEYDARLSYELPIHSPPRRVSAGVEHWLTSESPVARATASDTTHSSQHPYRLPSLPSSCLLPDCSDYADDVKYDGPTMNGVATSDLPFEQPAHHLHMSEVDNNAHDVCQPKLCNADNGYCFEPSHAAPIRLGRHFMDARSHIGPSSPYSSPGFFDDSPMYSPCSSAPDLYRPTSADCEEDPYRGRYAAGLPMHIPRSTANVEGDHDDDEEATGGKPYAQLIQECLIKAPGHRMMLRDIYDWFERNTTKPRESGGNGWQNSIRHNLSMNKAFENDKTTAFNARGEPKKASSVWFLTEHALRHGVQSTTRYRKQNNSRKSAYSRDLDWKRQNSGSKGGKASRKATQMRRLGAAAWASGCPPDELRPFDQLVHAATLMSDHPGTRRSSPLSPSDCHPCTPRTPIPDQEYPYSVDMANEFACQGVELSYHEVQLQEALHHAGYGGPSAGITW